jgi:Tfp pilus assembly protein PilN
MVNIGLAMKEVSLRGTKAGFSVVNLNALPDVYRPKARSLTELLTVPIIVIVIGLLAFWGLLVQSSATGVASLRAESDTTNLLVEKRQLERQAQMKAITELQERIEAVKASGDAFTAAAGELSQERAGVNGDLSEVWQALPYTVQLTSISRASDSSTICGLAPGEADVLTYARGLRASHRFSQVIISDITKTEDGVSFTFILLK